MAELLLFKQAVRLFMAPNTTNADPQEFVDELNTAPIFVVDDDIEYAEFIRELLKDNGFPNEVCHFTDGERLIEYASTLAAVEEQIPSLIVLDMKMKHIGGLDAMKWLKDSQLDFVPVIAVSAFAQWGEIAKAYELGVEVFMSKGQPVGELNAKIKTALTIPNWRLAERMSASTRAHRE